MGILGKTMEKADCLPVSAEWITPEGAAAGKAILYFYSAAHEAENSESYRAAVVNFIDQLGYKALLFQCFPASSAPVSEAVNSAERIYLWMLELGFHPEDIIFAGDNEGGGIEFCTLTKLRDDGIPVPAACAAFSPDLTIASPLLTDPSGLPPISIHVGYEDMLRDEVIHLGEIADAFNADVRIRVWRGLSRGCPYPASRADISSDVSMEAMKQMNSFIRQNLQKERSGIAAALLYMSVFSML